MYLDINPFVSSDEEFKEKIIKKFTTNYDYDVQPIEIINTEDDTGEFPKEERVEPKI
jgi:hypothetical protein